MEVDVWVEVEDAEPTELSFAALQTFKDADILRL